MKLLASFYKELTLLRRDRAALAILFVMPMALVLVVTLVQNNVLDSKATIDILLVDDDGGTLGQAIEEGLVASEFFEVRTDLEGVRLTPETLKRAVIDGKYQLGVVVHAAASEFLRVRVEQLVDGVTPDPGGADDITLILDPAMPAALESSAESLLRFLVRGEEVRVLIEQVVEALELDLSGGDSARALGESLKLGTTRLTGIRQEFATDDRPTVTPNAVQHNVPAWAMFGIFFIIMPISGSLLKERHEGTLMRLTTIPVAFPVLLFGKILAYVLVNLVQLGLMLWIGVAVLPRFGAPALSLGERPDLILAVGLGASLAATGSGLMLGAVARTYEQASALGPISIIIAAAVGGIMVPVFLMPRFMQPLSKFSPLHWGHDAFVGIFVRGAGFRELAPDLIRLLLFSAATISIALVFLLREE